MKATELRGLIEAADPEDLKPGGGHNEMVTAEYYHDGLIVQLDGQYCEEDRDLIVFLWNNRREILKLLEAGE